MNNETDYGKYVGDGYDLTKHYYKAYLTETTVNIVYGEGSEVIVASADIEEVSKNIEKYLWTPFVFHVNL